MDPKPETPRDTARIQDCLLRRDFGQAELLLRERKKSLPDHPETQFLWGVYYAFQNQIGRTIECFKRTLEANPRHTDAAICLSVVYNDIGKYAEAKKVFELANQSIVHRTAGEIPGVDRKFAVKHLELADLYFRYRRYDEAIDEYRKAAALDPKTTEIRFRLASTYAKKGLITRAVQELQQITQEDPRNVSARLQLGILHKNQGNWLDAELEWEAALGLEPENQEAKALLDQARISRNLSGERAAQHL